MCNSQGVVYLKPGRAFNTYKKLKIWYRRNTGVIPPNFKDRPYMSFTPAEAVRIIDGKFLFRLFLS